MNTNVEYTFEGNVGDNVFTPSLEMSEYILEDGTWQIFVTSFQISFIWNNYEQIKIITGSPVVSLSTKPIGLELDDWIISFDNENMIFYNFDSVLWNEVIKL